MAREIEYIFERAVRVPRHELLAYGLKIEVDSSRVKYYSYLPLKFFLPGEGWKSLPAPITATFHQGCAGFRLNGRLTWDYISIWYALLADFKDARLRGRTAKAVWSMELVALQAAVRGWQQLAKDPGQKEAWNGAPPARDAIPPPPPQLPAAPALFRAPVVQRLRRILQDLQQQQYHQQQQHDDQQQQHHQEIISSGPSTVTSLNAENKARMDRLEGALTMVVSVLTETKRVVWRMAAEPGGRYSPYAVQRSPAPTCNSPCWKPSAASGSEVGTEASSC